MHKGYSRGTRGGLTGALEGYGTYRGTHMVLTGYSRGTRVAHKGTQGVLTGALTGYSRSSKRYTRGYSRGSPWRYPSGTPGVVGGALDGTQGTPQGTQGEVNGVLDGTQGHLRCSKSGTRWYSGALKGTQGVAGGALHGTRFRDTTGYSRALTHPTAQRPARRWSARASASAQA